MRILIEGERYPIHDLSEIFHDTKFYKNEGAHGKILSVGYYHSYKNNEIVYILPKVFLKEDLNTSVFGIKKHNLFKPIEASSFKHSANFAWVRKLTVYFYNSLKEFQKRNNDNEILNLDESPVLNSNIKSNEYSYLDLLLTFLSFYKKNKNQIIFKYVEQKSRRIKKTKWSNTINKSLPLLNTKKEPVYLQFRNKNRVIDKEEDLITYFLSILNKFSTEHYLNLKIDNSYPILRGHKFDSLQKVGLSKLRKIKYRYFNDTMKKMYRLCELYFSKSSQAGINNKNYDYISVRSYNLVFEDMVEKLLSDNKIRDIITDEGTSLKDLKYNKDGKIIDHIFDQQSLFDDSKVFFIGDSKYYKPGAKAGSVSKFKQITYARNVIQYNVDLLNSKPYARYYKDKIYYRDDLTEGYNVSPNFFIYGHIDSSNYKNFNDKNLQLQHEVVRSVHFSDRLFDRDTLFVHQYQINFLFVLKSYSTHNFNKIDQLRSEIKKDFRANFIKYFSDYGLSGIKFYQYKYWDIKEFVNDNFKELLGKCIRTRNEETLIVAIYKGDKSLDKFLGVLEDFKFDKEF